MQTTLLHTKMAVDAKLKLQAPSSSTAAIPNRGVRVTPGHSRAREKNCIMAEKGSVLGHLFTVTTHNFEITATILITNILLVRRVQFMELGCQVWEPLFCSDTNRGSAATLTGYVNL